ELYRAAGLSTKGGGGNTVRNIMACPDAGVCTREAFDVSPHVIALTEFMLSDPASFRLPRKYKIAFSGCPGDCIGATVNDLGFIAKQGEGGPGFAVYVGGGMGPHARVAQLLEEFVPAHEAHLVAEAVKRVFDKNGNRKNKSRARLRYLVEERGFDGFKELYSSELTQLREESPAKPEMRHLPHRTTPTQAAGFEQAEGFVSWCRANVGAQKQSGYYLVHVPLFLGEISVDTLERLADVVETYGEGMVRATPSQNLVIRSVLGTTLPGLHRAFAALKMTGGRKNRSPVLREMIACTGASTCKLGICLSQGLAEAIRDELEHSELDLQDATLLRLHINGCPNSCGHHPIGSIALFGAARRIGDRLVPHYVLQLGGRLGEGRTRLAEGKEVLPARNVPVFLIEFLRVFRESEQYPDFDSFLDSGGREQATRIAAQYKNVPPFAQGTRHYCDWGENEPFSLAGRGPGECSAGVFDLIEVDLASARQALEEGKTLAAAELASRALLVTQGEEAHTAAEAFDLFEKHFLRTGLVDDSFQDLIAEARNRAARLNGNKPFDVDVRRISFLIDAVESLYENMDPSLRFKAVPQRCGPTCACLKEAQLVASDDVAVDREADFRGVTCPLNYVKTKLLLEQMNRGQVLSVLLDETGIRSVPDSAANAGHEVLSKQEEVDGWRVLIRRA
ncbi:MAG: sulfurtransferase TusA family protein, partial [Phycisphaerales bacterium]